MKGRTRTTQIFETYHMAFLLSSMEIIPPRYENIYIAMGKNSGKSFDKWILQEVAEEGKKRLVIALSKPSRRRYGGGGCNALTQPTSDDIKVGRTISFHGCNYLPPLSIHTQYTTEMFRTSKSYTTCQFGL